MNEDGINRTLLSPTEDEGVVPSKRRKFDAINSPKPDPLHNDSECLSEWEIACLEKEVIAYRTRLSNTEASAIELVEMKAKMDKALIEKEGILAMKAKTEKDTIKHLEIRLETLESNTQDLKPQMTAKAETSERKSIIQDNTDSLLKEYELARSSKFEVTISSSKLEDWKQVKREQVVKKNIGTQSSNLQSTALDDDNLPTQSKSVNSEKADWERDKTLLETRANNLEEQLQSAKNMISTLRAAVNEKLVLEEAVATITKKLDVAGRVEQFRVQGKCEESSSRVGGNETRVSGTLPTVSRHETSHRQSGTATLTQESGRQISRDSGQQSAHGMSPICAESTKMMENMKPTESVSHVVDDKSSSHQDETSDLQNHETNKCDDDDRDVFELFVNGHEVLVSHSKFFQIDYEKYYCKLSESKFACKKCPIVRSKRRFIEDHLWTQHCGGTFMCPHCRDASGSFKAYKARRSIAKHMTRHHFEQFSSKTPQVDDLQNEQGTEGDNCESSSNSDDVSQDADETPSDQNDDNDESSHDAEDSLENRSLRVGRSGLLVSHAKFFTIQWQIYFQISPDKKYICKQCSTAKGRKEQMVDHIWVEHFGGSYQCSLCSNPRGPLRSRNNIANHIRRYHSNR